MQPTNFPHRSISWWPPSDCWGPIDLHRLLNTVLGISMSPSKAVWLLTAAPAHPPQRSPLGALSLEPLGVLCCLGVLCWHHLSQCRLLFIAGILYSWDRATAAEGEVSCECWAPQFHPNEMSTKQPYYLPAFFPPLFSKAHLGHLHCFANI